MTLVLYRSCYSGLDILQILTAFASARRVGNVANSPRIQTIILALEARVYGSESRHESRDFVAWPSDNNKHPHPPPPRLVSLFGLRKGMGRKHELGGEVLQAIVLVVQLE